MRARETRWAAWALLLLIAANAEAQAVSAHLQVSVRVVPICRVAVSSLAFGSYDPLMTHAERPLDATARLDLLCTKNAPATIVLDLGRNARAEERLLAFGSDRVAYDLFRDSARTIRWADRGSSLQLVGQGTREPQHLTIYGRIPPAQEVPPGPYSDVIMAKVDF